MKSVCRQRLYCHQRRRWRSFDWGKNFNEEHFPTTLACATHSALSVWCNDVPKLHAQTQKQKMFFLFKSRRQFKLKTLIATLTWQLRWLLGWNELDATFRGGIIELSRMMPKLIDLLAKPSPSWLHHGFNNNLLVNEPNHFTLFYSCFAFLTFSSWVRLQIF